MILTALTGTLLASAGVAQAQTTTPPPAAPAAPAAPPAAPAAPAADAAPAPATAESSFSDADLKAYAHAAIEAGKIQQDAAIAPAEKQPKMLAALEAQGLDPVKFNAIAQASQADPALLKRIQDVAAADPTLNPPAAAAPAPQSAAPAPTTTP